MPGGYKTRIRRYNLECRCSFDMGIQKLLKQLNELWHASSDPRYRGEHPECIKIFELLVEEFRKLTDDELLLFLSPMNDDQLEQMYWPLTTLFDEGGRDWLSEYIWSAERTSQQ